MKIIYLVNYKITPRTFLAGTRNIGVRVRKGGIILPDDAHVSQNQMSLIFDTKDKCRSIFRKILKFSHLNK